MTKLSAANEVGEAINAPHALALDTGGTSNIGRAEAFLDRSSTTVQAYGWAFNTDKRVEVFAPLKNIAVSGGSGTFQWGEVVTETGSGATATFNRITSNVMYLAPLTGTLTGGQTLTGATSGATKTGAALTTTTTAAIAANPAWLTFKPAADEYRELSVVGGFIRSVPEGEAAAETFGGSVLVHTVTEESFTDVPDPIARFIVKDACVRFQRRIKGASADDAALVQERAEARLHAIQYDQSQAPANPLKTPESVRFKGSRRGVRF